MMNLIFLTMAQFDNLDTHNIYSDLLRAFISRGHKPYLISPASTHTGQNTQLVAYGSYTALRVEARDIDSSSLVKKGVATVLLEKHFIAAIKKHLSGIKFDVILYSTPPVTFARVIKYLKKVHHAPTYLLLKDIFPQNAVDLAMFSKRSAIYLYFRHKERQLYKLSDKIGCMSIANMEYVLQHNPEITREKVEVCPNSLDPRDLRLTDEGRGEMRRKYGIPLDKTVFVYGGNLGKPQGIPFLIECLKTQLDNDKVLFLIVGSGTECCLLESFMMEHPKNVSLMRQLPKEDYDRMIAACDVGLIFLDHRFTIPNFPSRLLSYMQAGLPVLACTDTATDIGKVIVDGGFGWWCESDDPEGFDRLVSELPDDYNEYGLHGIRVLNNEYSVETCFQMIINSANR